MLVVVAVVGAAECKELFCCVCWQARVITFDRVHYAVEGNPKHSQQLRGVLLDHSACITHTFDIGMQSVLRCSILHEVIARIHGMCGLTDTYNAGYGDAASADPRDH